MFKAEGKRHKANVKGKMQNAEWEMSRPRRGQKLVERKENFKYSAPAGRDC